MLEHLGNGALHTFVLEILKFGYQRTLPVSALVGLSVETSHPQKFAIVKRAGVLYILLPQPCRVEPLFQVFSETFHTVLAETTAVVSGAGGRTAVVVDVQSIDRRKTRALGLVEKVKPNFGVVGAEPIGGVAFVLVIPKPWDPERIPLQIDTGRFEERLRAEVDKARKIHQEIDTRAVAHSTPFSLGDSLLVLLDGVRVARAWTTAPTDHSAVKGLVLGGIASVHEDHVTFVNHGSLLRAQMKRTQRR